MLIKCIYTFLISMVPVIELRGAIPVGVASGLPYWLAVVLSLAGNLVPIPFIIVFGGKILRYFAKYPKFGIPFRWLLRLGESKVAKMKRTLFVALWLFVAIPFPGTGAWTGALIAITLNLKLRESFPAIALGVISAAAIVTLITFGVDIFIN